MKKIITFVVIFLGSIMAANAQISRLSVDTVSSIKKAVTVNTFRGVVTKKFCIPLLHIDRKIFYGDKKELLSLIPENKAPQTVDDLYVLIRQGTTTSVYKRQKQGYWEQLSSTHETVSSVRVVDDEVYVTLLNMPVKDYKVALINRDHADHFLTHVPFVTHYDFISRW